ncbi:SDR family oxidoreductase [Cyanobium gracile UHCC 0139]|uniref:SDR family oxidoreductase n=1 Tax=Cyanobium gracile UHCC 0139 TaxID=3110308 RepID=A0ABU5RTY0_9CYAN|nr:SDR family oxidoreductase [Cyanobium gracile]MEA5391197.1 SDR family oxidoreductase [Cyanobium gracile UHCC 0139]
MSESSASPPSSLAYGALIDSFLAAHPERPALAERAYALEADPATGTTRRRILAEFRPITYRTLRDRVRCLAAAWHSDPDGAIRRGERVAIIGFASIDYAVIDLALAYIGAVPMPLSGHHSAAEYDAILERATPAALAVSIAQLPAVVDLVRRHACLRQLIVFDADTRITAERTLIEQAEAMLRAAGSSVPLLLPDLIVRGDGLAVPPPAAVEAEAMALLIHTSGSTGVPKGACISAAALINTWRQVSGPDPKVAVVLAPFHHMMGRDAMVTALNAGGLACFTLKPDLSTVFEDIRVARPTGLVLFPRLCEWIDQHVRTTPSDDLRLFLGDRLESIVVASAPIAPRIRALMEETFGVPVHEGYSSTETASGGLAMNGRLNPNVLDYRLRDVAESGYFLSDRPYPRGELCVKTRFGIRAYFRNPEATADLFDADGFACTGDVVEERGPGQIALIDRRRNVIKLSQGEYVAVGALEQLFADGCASVAQIHVHGESRRSYLLAVVVPDPEALARRPRPPADDAELIALVRDELVQLAGERGLKSFEIPRDLLLAEEPFSHANGLLSSLGKPLRPAIRQRYAAALAALYDRHDRLGDAALASLRQPGAERSLEERLRLLLAGTLGVHDQASLQDRCFRELGGDSLAAVQLSVRIEAEFGVAIEASRILGPDGTIATWARILREHRGEGPRIPPAGGADGPGPVRELSAADVRVEAFIDAATLQAAGALPPASGPARSLLLTGANGFLGGRVALAWLERLASTGGRLVCLVRPSHTQSARERLDARFAHLDPAVAARWRSLAADHLEVVAGDIGEPRLGLDAATYHRLAHGIEAIVHGAALVNHRLDYHHLSRPNVIGTAEIVRLALTQRRKSIAMVSTIGVTPLKEPIRLDGSYANGYFASKWACEQLLRSTHAATGLPIRILRSGLVLPDRHLAGERNPDDILSRLIHSLLLTGLAPPGFRASGLPVDQLAQAIVALGDGAREGFELLTLGGPADGTFPLEALVERIEAAGFPLERTASYGEWLERIEPALLRLPAAQRSLSLLDVLEAYRPAPVPAAAGPQAETFAGFPATYLDKVCADAIAAAGVAAA